MNEVEKIEQYLLGELSEDEGEKFEEQFFCDGDLFEEIQAAEMALIDRYVRNAMPLEERKRFEEKFLVTPERRSKVAESEAFHTELRVLRAEGVVAEEKTSWFERLFGSFGFSVPSMQFAHAAMLLLMSVGIAWLIYDSRQVRQELLQAKTFQQETEVEMNERLVQKERELSDRLAEQGNSEAETLTALESEIDNLRQQLEEARQRPSGNGPATPKRVPVIATLVLLSARGAGSMPEVSLGKETRVLNLRIPVGEASNDAFAVEITRGDSVVMKAASLKTRGTTLSISIPTRNLSEGRYDVTVRNRAGDEMTSSFVVKTK